MRKSGREESRFDVYARVAGGLGWPARACCFLAAEQPCVGSFTDDVAVHGLEQVGACGTGR
jgi:hypothetical protein